MCQYAKNCKNFIPDEVNDVSCVRVCVRNPLLDYEIADNFKPIKQVGREPDVEFNRPEVIKNPIGDLKEEISDIEDDDELTSGEKKDKIMDKLIEKNISKSTSSEPIENLHDTEPNKESGMGDREERQKQEVKEAVEESKGQNSMQSGEEWKVPKRRKR